ncbi:MAG: 30S ribosomal protein S6 [Fimbriimonadia bacterium]|nr:30S ribosomal protein S6 [Fimbriimonadia bacterium]
MSQTTPYEAMVIVPANLEEERVNALLERFQKTLTDHQAVIRTAKQWDKRKLTYEINKVNEGIFLLIEFDGHADAVNELHRVLHLTEEVLRARVFRQEPVEDKSGKEK